MKKIVIIFIAMLSQHVNAQNISAKSFSATNMERSEEGGNHYIIDGIPSAIDAQYWTWTYPRYLRTIDTGAHIKKEVSTYIIEGVVVENIANSFTHKPEQIWILPKNPNDYILTRKEIEQLPYTNINDMVATLPGVYQARRGDELHIYGSR